LLDKRDEMGAPLISKYFEELRFRFVGQSGVQPTAELLNALFDIGDDVLRIAWDSGLVSPAPRAMLAYLISDICTKWGPEQAGVALLAPFEACKSLAFCADIWVSRAAELGEIPLEGSSRSSLISLETLKVLGDLLLVKIEAANASGSLDEEPFYFAIASAWSYLAKDDGVRARSWISKGVSRSALFLAKMALNLLSYSVEPSGRRYMLRARPSESFYDLDVLRSACARHAIAKGLSTDEMARIRALKSGLDRIASETSGHEEAPEST
jgi:hypothetical protein